MGEEALRFVGERPVVGEDCRRGGSGGGVELELPDAPLSRRRQAELDIPIVTVEQEQAQQMADVIKRMTELPGVLAASMIYHQFED